MNYYITYWNKHYNREGFYGPRFYTRRQEAGRYSYPSPGHKFDSQNNRFADKTRFDRYQKLTDKARKLYWDKKIKC